MSSRPQQPSPSKRCRTNVGVQARAGRQGAHVVEMQRRRLTLAIVEVAGENGLEAASIGRICEQAGVSRRTFYELFEDREACLLAAFDAQIERLGSSVCREFESGGRWRDGVRQSLVAVLEQLDVQPDVARVCLIETQRAGSQLLERRREILKALASAIDIGRTEARVGSEPPPLTAQGVVGGALSVIQARLLERRVEDAERPLVQLTGPLMAMIVHPYLRATAARRELEQSTPTPTRPNPRRGADPFKGLPIRFTYRTALVLATIASDPGASNRHVADCAGIVDEGQISRLLRRLQSCELIENGGQGHTKGEANAWRLTTRGEAIHAAIAAHDAAG
jgi:AcrR family transcriptional regulator